MKSDHIAVHDDHAYTHQDGILCSRDIALVYYLTKDWKESFGGVFIDKQTNSKIVPKFNTLIAFTVPRFHEVTKMTTSRIRYSFFGWFLSEGDLYSFTPEKAVKKKRRKKRKRKLIR